MGWGAVVRDHHGTLKFTATEGISTPEMAEALAIRGALSTVLSNGFKDIVLASDCLSMIQRIQSSLFDRSAVGALVSDIKLLAAKFNTCSFKHYGRKINQAAHILAHSCENSVCNISFDVIPECIREVLYNDLY
jgi:ribonuclease HI